MISVPGVSGVMCLCRGNLDALWTLVEHMQYKLSLLV